jgi:protein-tyrosine phosphatase
MNGLLFSEAGISRSPTITAAYLMKTFQMSVDEALSLIKQKRPGIFPNEGLSLLK